MNTIADCVMLTLVCLLGTFSVGEGVYYSKSCYTLRRTYPINVEKFMGKWYELQRLYDPLDPEQEDCVVMSYQLLGNGTIEILKSFQMNKDGATNYVGSKAVIKTFKETRATKYYGHFNTTNAVDPDAFVEILISDEHLALLYSCTPINSTHYRQSCSVLSRTPTFRFYEQSIIDYLLSVMRLKTKSSEGEWRVTKQSHKFCKNVPETEDLSGESDRTTSEAPRTTQNLDEISTETPSEASMNR